MPVRVNPKFMCKLMINAIHSNVIIVIAIAIERITAITIEAVTITTIIMIVIITCAKVEMLVNIVRSPRSFWRCAVVSFSTRVFVTTTIMSAVVMLLLYRRLTTCYCRQRSLYLLCPWVAAIWVVQE